MEARGRMFIVARSVSAIESVARGWPIQGDGYLSNARRGMFQHGMTRKELADLALAASLCPTDEQIGAIPEAVTLLPS